MTSTTTETTYRPTMPYSQERLELALGLFCRMRPHLKRRGLPHEHLEQNLKSKYELRWGTLESAKKAPSTWIDDDDSADYDPKQDFPKRKFSKARVGQKVSAERPAKRQRRLSVSEEDEEEKEDDDDDEPGLLVTLKTTSERGRAFLSCLRDRSSDEYEGNIYEDAAPGLCNKRYPLRSRGKSISSLLALFDPQPSPEDSQAPTQSILSLDLGHPAARGCISCWEFNQDCSLVDNPAFYPCQICREDGLDCELIIQPRQKRGCENCKKKRKVVCSYLQSNHQSHHLPCTQCQTAGIRCCAGPAKEKKMRVSDENETQDDDIGDTFVHLVCPPQKGHTETIQPLPTPESLRRSSVDDSNLDTGATAVCQDSQPEPGEEEEEEQHGETLLKPSLATSKSVPCGNGPVRNGPTPVTRVITTSFAHPINFSYEPPADGTKPCHWCHDFRYGIIGLGTLNVEIIDYHDGNGYIEIEGGHVGQGHEPSRMCIICALERLHIMNCRGHTISPLEGHNEQTFDYDAAYESLLQEPGQDRDVKLALWCMLCPRPAFYGCVTVQSVDKFQEPVDPSDPAAKGCGLLLCSDCARLCKEFGADLERVVSENRKSQGEDGVRADAVYLLPENDLWKSYSG